MDKKHEEEVNSINEEIRTAIAEAKPQSPDSPRINTYICKECGHHTHTVDVAEGTTTMVLPCMKGVDSKIVNALGEGITSCSGQMTSTFYAARDIPLSDVKYEWRYATLPEYRDYKKKHMALADHVASGGLVMHKRGNKDALVLTHGNFYAKPDGTRLTEAEVESNKTGLQILKDTIRLEKSKIKRKRHDALMKQQKTKQKRRAKGKKKR